MTMAINADTVIAGYIYLRIALLTLYTPPTVHLLIQFNRINFERNKNVANIQNYIALATGHYPLHGHNETLIYGIFILMHIKHPT